MAHKANQRKYEEGLLSVLELQTSSNQALAAKAERLNSALTYLIKKRIVGYYQGNIVHQSGID
jgi:outer membrane protein